MDKNARTRDKKAEKKFRDLIEKFIEWLKNASSDSGDSSSDEEENKEEKAKVSGDEEEKDEEKTAIENPSKTE